MRSPTIRISSHLESISSSLASRSIKNESSLIGCGGLYAAMMPKCISFLKLIMKLISSLFDSIDKSELLMSPPLLASLSRLRMSYDSDSKWEESIEDWV